MRVILAVWAVADPNAAETFTSALAAIAAGAVAVKVAVVWPAGTVRVDGTVSVGLLLVIETADPPEGAGALNVTVQVAALLGPKLAGQLREERVVVAEPESGGEAGAVRVILAFWTLAPNVAVTFTSALAAIVAGAVAVKV